MPSTAVLALLGLQLTAVQSGAQNRFSAQAGAISSGYSARFDLASESILNVHGDSWTTAWCDNDQQYVFSDDSTNIDGRCVNATNSKGYNITYGQLTTSSPYSFLAGFALSCMPEYGIENETVASSASSNSCRATWKATGQACLGSVLYMSISRHVYAWNGFGNTGADCYADRQKAFDGSVIKSSDGGASWSSRPGLDAAAPEVQFPGSIFGTPSFIQYGKGSQDWLPVDGSEDYVYAVSNDGYWDNGNQLFLARASRNSDLMSRRSWEYLSNSSPLSWNPLRTVLNSNASFEWMNEDGTSQDWPTYGRATVVTNESGRGNQTHWGGHSLLLFSPQDGAYRTITGLNAGSTYYLTAYARVTNTADAVMVGVNNYGSSGLYADTHSLEWSRQIVAFTPTGSSADIYCWKESGAQPAFCDDIELSDQPPPLAVLDAPGRVSVTQIQYVPPSNGAPGLYLMPQWYYSDPNRVCASHWAFYLAEVPWGPWTKLHVGDDGPDAMEQEWSDCSDHTRGYYNPTVVPKWVGEYDPATHEREIWLLYGGDFSSEVAYKPHLLRMLLKYPSATGNLLPNGDFERGYEELWTSPTATVAHDSAYNGSQSARVSNNDGFMRVISGLTPGDTYQISGYLQVTALGDEVRIGVKDYGGPELSAAGAKLNYTQRIINFTPIGTSATIYCWKRTGSSDAYCDAMQLSKP